jgi:uncharacterized MAPEG superfamily protein
MTPTIALIALFAAVAIPLLFTGIGGALRKREFGNLDAHHPRIQQARATQATARAIGAANNGWEALGMFAPAVLFTLVSAPTSSLAPIFALAWIPLRLVHGASYVADKPPVRTAAFAGGVLCVLGLLLVGGRVIG